MGLHKEDYEDNQFSDEDYDMDMPAHKKDVRKKLEERLERKRLREELEDYEGELDGEFDWDNLNR